MKAFLKLIILLVVMSTTLLAQNRQDIQRMVNNQEWEEAMAALPSALRSNPQDVDLHVLAGGIYLEMEKYQEAYDVLDKANRMDRRKPNIMRPLATALSYLGRHTEAIEILNDAIRRNEKDVSMRLTLAEVYIRADSLRRAELVITTSLDMDKKNPAAYVALGDLYFAQKVYALARQNYEEAIKLDPNLFEAQAKLATSYYWLGQRERDSELRSELFQRSINSWEELVKKDPRNAPAHYELGRIYYLASDFRNSSRILSQYIDLRPSSSLGRWLLAQSYYEIGSCEEAKEHLEIVAVEIDSVSQKARLLLARCYYDIKDFDKSIEAFTEIRNGSQLETRDMQFYGQAYLMKQDTVNALKIWTEVIFSDPNETCKLMDQVGYLYNQRQDYRMAIDVLLQRISLEDCVDGRENIVNYLIGSSYQFIEQPDSAVYYLNRSIELDSNFLIAQVSLADAYAALGEDEISVNTFNQIIEKAKSDTERNRFVLIQSFSKLAGIELEKKNFNEVIKVGQQWSEVFPDAAFAHLYIAIAHHNLNNGGQACRSYRKVLEFDKNNQTAKSNLKMLQDAGLCE